MIDPSVVTIVGGGPAGAITSLFLSKKKIAHTIIEAQSHPRNKACADVITSIPIRILNELDPGIINSLAQFQEAHPNRGLRIYSGGKQPIVMHYKPLDNQEGIPSCFSIPRAELDAKIWDCVVASPYATVILNESIKKPHRTIEGWELQLSNGAVFKTKLLVVATGCNSPLNEQIGGIKKEPKHTAVGIRAYYTGIDIADPNYCELIVDQKIMPGGLYIAPLSGNKFNVNLVIRKDKLLKSGLKLQPLFEQLIKEHPSLSDKFHKAERISGFKGSSLLLGTKKRSISGEGYLLVGDAAGLIDLISANGIPQAMTSAKVAVKTIMFAIAQNNFSAHTLKGYDRELQLQVSNDLQLGRMLQYPLRFNWFNNWLIRCIRRISNFSSTNETLQYLFYDNHLNRTLKDPKLYWNLFAGKKYK